MIKEICVLVRKEDGINWDTAYGGIQKALDAEETDLVKAKMSVQFNIKGRPTTESVMVGGGCWTTDRLNTIILNGANFSSDDGEGINSVAPVGSRYKLILSDRNLSPIDKAMVGYGVKKGRLFKK